MTGCGSNNSDKQSSETAQNTETEQDSSERENSDEAETTATVTEAAATKHLNRITQKKPVKC